MKNLLLKLKAFISSSYELKFWTIIILLSITLIWIGVELEQKEKREKYLKEEKVRIELNAVKDSAKELRLRNGELAFQINAQEIDQKNLKFALEQNGFELKKLRQAKIKLDQIVSAQRSEIEVIKKDSFRIVKVPVYINGNADTIRSFHYTDHYLTLQGEIRPGYCPFTYSYRDSIQFVTTKQKDGYLVTGFVSNPNARLTTGNQILIKKPPRSFFSKPWLWTAAGFIGGYFVFK